MLFHVETMKLAMALLVSSAYLLDVVSGKGVVVVGGGGGSKVGKRNSSVFGIIHLRPLSLIYVIHPSILRSSHCSGTNIGELMGHLKTAGIG